MRSPSPRPPTCDRLHLQLTTSSHKCVGRSAVACRVGTRCHAAHVPQRGICTVSRPVGPWQPPHALGVTLPSWQTVSVDAEGLRALGERLRELGGGPERVGPSESDAAESACGWFCPPSLPSTQPLTVFVVSCCMHAGRQQSFVSLACDHRLPFTFVVPLPPIPVCPSLALQLPHCRRSTTSLWHITPCPWARRCRPRSGTLLEALPLCSKTPTCQPDGVPVTSPVAHDVPSVPHPHPHPLPHTLPHILSDEKSLATSTLVYGEIAFDSYAIAFNKVGPGCSPPLATTTPPNDLCVLASPMPP